MNNPKNDSHSYVQGRGAQINPANPFHNEYREDNGQIWHDGEEIQGLKKTEYLETNPKTILNKVKSPDLHFEYSMNPYQGCEHGCVYCYARNTHTFWGFSAGIEFEQKILVKKRAPEILKQKLQNKKWKPYPIMFSGNTDCYQPAEKKFRLTRQMLEILWQFRHPVSIITKSSMILRDIDLLSKMAELNLVKVAISLTSLDESLRQKLEPRTASGQKRLMVIEKLSEAGVPVNAMLAPIIPSLNDTEIPVMAKAAANAGAKNLSYTIVRLNGDVGEIFKDWLHKNYPDRHNRVIHQIESCHGGRINDNHFGRRMKGEGQFANIIKQQIYLARAKYFKGRSIPDFDLSLYELYRDRQLRLF